MLCRNRIIPSLVLAVFFARGGSFKLASKGLTSRRHESGEMRGITAAAARAARSKAPPLVAPPRLLAAAASGGETSVGESRLGAAYALAGAASVASWTVCAFTALGTHPYLDLPVRHNLLTIAQALCFPVPVFISVFAALSAAATKGGKTRLKSATYRRLNLGLFASSMWLLCAAMYYPLFATGYDQYPRALVQAAAVAHGATACLAFGAWARSAPLYPELRRLRVHCSAFYLPRLVRGLAGSFWSLAPKQPAGGGGLDDPDVKGRDARAEYALAALLFGVFAVLPLLKAFPAATVPTILGKRLARPATAFTWLAAVSCYCLKDAAERGRLAASTFATLRKGLLVGCGLHLGLLFAKVAGADGGHAGLLALYPAMVSKPGLALCSLAMHVLALVACLTPVPLKDAEQPKPSSEFEGGF
mmetsp:Transcript_8869/g.20021  ORF Transcript_8869/g.20021 Transcript_8869/m.20021 type:complete len:418 (-) Transcript_8869:307-1560(-)